MRGSGFCGSMGRVGSSSAAGMRLSLSFAYILVAMPSWRKQGDQHADDGDDDQQFDQCEAPAQRSGQGFFLEKFWLWFHGIRSLVVRLRIVLRRSLFTSALHSLLRCQSCVILSL